MAHLARFNELPDELLRHVILLSASQPNASIDPLADRRRRTQLESLSLVCRAWRPIAQRALVQPERPVQVFHAKQLAPLVEVVGSPEQAIGNLVQALDIEMWGETQDSRLVGAIQACRRLESLALTHIERVRLDELAAGEDLASLSLRQCTLVSAYYPDPPPESDSTSWIPRSLLLPITFSTLSRLDLRLCSLRRDFLPLALLEASARSPAERSLLPNLRHLLLFTGSHDQSPATIRALVRSVAHQLHSLSLDHTAYELLFPPDEPGTSDRLSFPELKCYGTYWDAAYHTLVGLPIALPALAASNSTDLAASRPVRAARNAVSYLHTALYPAQLESLAAALESVLTNPKLKAAHAWAGVEQWTIEGTLRDLDHAEDELDLETDEEEVDSDIDESGAEDLSEGEDERGATSGRAVPTQRERPQAFRTEALRRFARLEANLDLRIEPAASADDIDASEGPLAGDLGAPSRVQRATFERGFGTSWWRFVDDVGQGRL